MCIDENFYYQRSVLFVLIRVLNPIQITFPSSLAYLVVLGSIHYHFYSLQLRV